MRMSEDGPLQPTPLWDRDDLSPGGLVREFLRECRIVRKGLDGSLFKVRPSCCRLGLFWFALIWCS